MTIGFVVGLRAEARLLKKLDAMVAVGGGGAEGAARAAQRLMAKGVRKIVSFGLAGGLDPALKAGDIVVPSRIIADGEEFECDPDLVQWLGGGGDNRALLGGDQVLADGQSKAKAFFYSNASAVDLESAAVARVTKRAGVGFAVLRAICDPADRDLPPAALLALDRAGKIGALRVLGSVLRRPAQIGSLLGLARDAGLARGALVACVDRLSQVQYDRAGT